MIGGMDADSKTLSLAAFQRHVSERWEAADRARGSAATFVLFIEEVGELARALHKNDRANLREEFADCLAWLCTLANINDVDLAEAVAEKYLGEKRPEGSK
jgi:NTP pyrophosphatase (non-canonical NTP hydrolase)